MARLLRILGSGLLTLLAATAVQASPIRTVLLGDSITFGIVSGEPAGSYAQLLGEDLGSSYDLVNVALSGSSAFYWAPDAPCPGVCTQADTLFDDRATPELPADIVTILLGTNDAVSFLLAEPTPVDDWEGYMREIVSAVFTAGASDVILMTPPRGGVASGADALLEGYRERTGKICEDTPGVSCGPDLYALLDVELDFEPGDVHPNGAGHAKIAEGLAAAIRRVPEPSTGLLLSVTIVWMAGSSAPRGARPGI